MAPSPAKVSYQNGLLSVESTNARLLDILNAVRAKTGIQFEGLPSGQERDRVAGKFGPAPADQVLTSLLQGSHFDYVIMGTPDNPSQVQRVILTPNGGSGAVAASSGPQPAQQAQGDDEDDSSDDSAESTEQPQGAQQQPAQGAQAPNRGPKSAEQLLNELKRMQQQAQQSQQQQQQGQPQDTPNQPPVPH
jgi:hypothetical protein